MTKPPPPPPSAAATAKPAPKKLVVPAPSASAAHPARPAKTFTVASFTDAGCGEKITMFGKSGIGKTTCAAMAPGAVFIGIDDGGRKIRNPLTGEPVQCIPGIETFQDIRDAVRQPGLFKKGQTVVIDTITKVEEFAQTHILETVKQSGKVVSNFRGYGWDGDRHMLDAYRCLLTDLDSLVRQGVNVILLAQLSQITVANAAGVDYLEDGPKLQHRKDCSVRTEVIEWSDHVFRIGYLELDVEKENSKDRAGKVTSENDTRCVYTSGAQHFAAKSRPVSGNRKVPAKVPSIVSFASENDDSIWQIVFGGAEVAAS